MYDVTRGENNTKKGTQRERGMEAQGQQTTDKRDGTEQKQNSQLLSEGKQATRLSFLRRM